MPPKLKPTHRARVENEMIRRREKLDRHEQMWTDRQKYYERWDKNNTKFDEWTSPRYHETQNKLTTDLRNKQEKEEALIRRKDKLRKLLMNEEKLYDIEVMIYKTKNSTAARRPKSDDIPTQVLKEINLGLKLEEEERARHEAELKLYHQWRTNNPMLKHYERMQRGRDLKLSWLDQQIENRMRKEKDEEECRKLLKERDQKLKEAQLKEEHDKKLMEIKRQQLKEGLDRQLEELNAKSKVADLLKKAEENEWKKKRELDEIEDQRLAQQRKMLDSECALYNIKQYKMKLTKKAVDIRQALDQELALVEKLKQLQLAETVEDQEKRRQINETMTQFIKLIREQKELEKSRQRQMDFLFDSEAKLMFEQQDEIWREEERARMALMKDVVSTIKAQISDNMERNQAQQRQLLTEKEESLKKAEEYKREMEQLRTEETRRKMDCLKLIEDDVKMKKVQKKMESSLELKKINEDLERTRREEERLKREIMNIQRRQGPIRPPRSRLYF